MHSYKTLAVLALAASTASPALSAPISVAGLGDDAINLLKQLGIGGALGALGPVADHFLGGNGTRRALDERAPISVAGLGDDAINLLKQLGIGGALGALGPVADHFLGGNGTRRALDERASAAGAAGVKNVVTKLKPDGSFGEAAINGLLSGLAGAVATVGASELFDNNSTRRELDERASAASAGAVAKNLLGKLTTEGSLVGSAVNGILSGLAAGAATVGASALLDNDNNSTRRALVEREPLSLSADTLSGLGKTLAGSAASLLASLGIKDVITSNNTRREALDDGSVVVRELLSALSRRLEELD